MFGDNKLLSPTEPTFDFLASNFDSLLLEILPCSHHSVHSFVPKREIFGIKLERKKDRDCLLEFCTKNGPQIKIKNSLSLSPTTCFFN